MARPHFTGCSGELCCGGGIPPGLVRAPVDSEWGRGYLKATLAAVSDCRRKVKGQGEGRRLELWGAVGKDRRIDLRAV